MNRHNEVMIKLVGMVEMCGDIPPTPEQWAKFVEFIQADYAACVAERLAGDRPTPTFAGYHNYSRGPFYNTAQQDDVARAIGQYPTAIGISEETWTSQGDTAQLLEMMKVKA